MTLTWKQVRTSLTAMTANPMRPKSGTTLTQIAKGFLVDGLSKRPYNTHMNTRELKMKDYIVYTCEGVLIMSAPNLETAYELANEWELDIESIELAERLN